MTSRTPAKKTTPRKPRAVRQPTDHQPKAAPAEPVELTEADFGVDIAVVLRALGVDPGTVKNDTTRLYLADNKVLIEYVVMRAVPPRIMGLALLAGVPHEEEKGDGDD